MNHPKEIFKGALFVIWRIGLPFALGLFWGLMWGREIWRD
jgi:hypothetical protein